MRRNVTIESLQRFMQEFAAAARGPGNVYFTSGATALLLKFREQTIAIDLKLDPEPEGAFEAIALLKNRLHLNVELASPDDFIPPAADWRERSRHIASLGRVQFFHYDFSLQALAKLERGHAQDLEDVTSFVRGGYVTPDELRQRFAQIEPGLLRYPAIDPGQFRRKLDESWPLFSRMKTEDREALLPGQELVEQGLADLLQNRISDFSLLLLIAAPRLRRLGIDVPERPFPRPCEHHLYTRLEDRLGPAAHSFYNSLLRRIVSYARALERERSGPG